MKHALQRRTVLILALCFVSQARSQADCSGSVVNNTVVVNTQTLEELEDRGAALQDLVDCLADGGSVVFDLRTLTADVTVNVSRSIHFLSAPGRRTRLTCNNRPVFDIKAKDVVLSNLTANNCVYDGLEDQKEVNCPVIVRAGSQVSLRSVSFENNNNVWGPAVILAEANSTVDIRDSHFVENQGRSASVLKAGAGCEVSISNSTFKQNRGRGGVAVLIDSNRLDVSGCRFTRNVATHRNGGAILVKGHDIEANVTIREASRYEGNRAEGGEGGALSVVGKVSLQIDGNTRFVRNSAALRGGAVFVQTSSALRINDALFIENSSNFSGGGAVYAEHSSGASLTIHVKATLFLRNVARNYIGSGGGLRVWGENITCTVSDFCIFSLNQAELDGGGMHVGDVDRLRISDTTFAANEAIGGSGAALYLAACETFTSWLMDVEILNSVFIFNQAMHSSRGGGSIVMTGVSSMTNITNCVFKQNNAGSGPGGALYASSGPSLIVSGSDFDQNSGNSGGAVYAQREVRLSIRGSRFNSNTAGEGGAMRTHGDVDLTLQECVFTKNLAATEGGAAKVRTLGSRGSKGSLVAVHNCAVRENQAGIGVSENPLYETTTSGGGFCFVGNGVEVEVKDSYFSANRAAHGGAIYAEAVAEWNVASSRFENNTASFGGAVYLAVDENVETRRYEMYLFDRTLFALNSAGDGGGVYVRNSRNSFSERSANTRRFMMNLLVCEFRHNSAGRNGGAFTVSGCAIKVGNNTVFEFNRAVPEGKGSSHGRGGAIKIQNGATLQIDEVNFERNSAVVGGAVSVRDASLEASSVTFNMNSAANKTGEGVGGAVALEISSTGETDSLRSILPAPDFVFQAWHCTFIQNNASLRGGGLYLHRADPDVRFTTEDCGPTECLPSFQFQRSERGRGHHPVILHDVAFIKNRAQMGGAVFTNDPSMVVVSTTPLSLTNRRRIEVDDSSGEPLLRAMRNDSYLKSAGIRFEGNSNSGKEVSQDAGATIATTPAIPVLRVGDRMNRESAGRLHVEPFYSGHRLQFSIILMDATGEQMTAITGLRAVIVHDEDDSKSNRLDLFGQRNAEVDESGVMRFTDTRLRGFPGVTYLLRVDYHREAGSLSYSLPSSYIHVAMHPCRLGEETHMRKGLPECQPCPLGTIGKHPETKCTRCKEMENGDCNGDTVVPKADSWHSTSTSLKMYRCIGAESCHFDGRENLIQRTASKSHSAGQIVRYMNETDIQCGKGYAGPLCGSCETGYGRINLRCLQCGVKAMRYFLLIFLTLWTVALLSYFIKTVLELPLRSKRNTKFRTEAPVLRSRIQERYPDFESRTGEMLPTADRNNQPQLSRKRRSNLGKRAAAVIFDKKEDVQLLTLADPTAEVVKIVLNFLQVTASAAYIAFRWTDQIRSLLVAMGAAGNIAAEQNFLSLDCFMNQNVNDKALRRMVITILQPVMFLCLFLFIWIVAKLIRRRSTQYLRQRMCLTFLAIHYFAYIGMTKNLLRFLACVDIQDTDIDISQRGRYWQEDTSVMCYTRKHGFLVGVLVIPLICVVTLGFPFGTAYILRRNEHKLGDEDFMATYGFLYRAYKKPDWEVVIMLRKAAIAAIAVFAQLLGHNLQALLCILVLITALSLQLIVQPFTQELNQLNGLEVISLASSIVVFVVGLMMNDPWTTYKGRVFLGVVTYIVVFGALGVMAKELMLAVEEFVDSKILQFGLMNIAALIDAGLLQKGKILAQAYLEKVSARVCAACSIVSTRSIVQNASSMNPPHSEETLPQ